MIFYPLPRQSYTNHRNLLAEALAENAIAILHSNDRYPISSDQYFPFRQNKDLLRLCGIYQEETALLLYPGHPLEAYHEILFIKRNDEAHKTWNGQLLDKEAARNISGIQSVYWFDEFESIVYPMIPKAECIYLNSNEKAQYPISIFGRNERLGKKVMKQFPFYTYKRLQPILRIQSLSKSKEELENIKKAIKITGDTWNSLSRIIKPGLFEYEIEAEISYAFEKLGAIHAFQPIIAAGKSACVLHYTSNNQLLYKDDLLLVDFGAEVNGYAADMTRVKAIDGSMTSRQFEVYDQVLNLVQKTMAMMKPKTTIHEINIKMTDEVLVSLEELGLITSEEAKNKQVSKKYLPHGISHFLGSDVHDYGDKYTTLAPGMVITCEPGIYIEEEGIGIRLENDILITKNGCEDLMKDFEL